MLVVQRCGKQRRGGSWGHEKGDLSGELVNFGWEEKGGVIEGGGQAERESLTDSGRMFAGPWGGCSHPGCHLNCSVTKATGEDRDG